MGWSARHARTGSIKNYQDREEIVQDVFCEVFKRIADFEGGNGSSFRGWLRTITRSKISNLVRHAARRKFPGGGEADYINSLEQAAQHLDRDDDNDALILLRQALEQIRGEFSAAGWQAFWRTACEGRPAPAVAGELHMTPEAVRKARERVLRRLREIYADLLT